MPGVLQDAPDILGIPSPTDRIDRVRQSVFVERSGRQHADGQSDRGGHLRWEKEERSGEATGNRKPDERSNRGEPRDPTRQLPRLDVTDRDRYPRKEAHRDQEAHSIPHSENVATSVTHAAASLIKGTAASAPLPSPSLRSRSSNGSSPSFSNSNRWPGSVEQCPAMQ